MNRLRSSVGPCLVLLVVCGAVCAQPQDSSNGPSAFDTGVQQYAQGRYAAAAETWETLVGDGRYSAPVYFNLGNAYMKMERPGLALLNYRRAQLLAPRNDEIRHNIQYVHSELAYQPAEDVTTWWHWLVRRVTDNTTINELVILTVIIYWITAGLAVWRLYTPRRLATALLVAAVVALVAGCGLCVVEYNSGWGSAEAVVVEQSPLLSGPGPAFDALASIPEGAQVRVLGTRGQYREVRTDAGGRGWVAKDIARLISPARAESEE